MKKEIPWSWLCVSFLMTLLLGGSVFLNVALWNRAKQYYQEANATRLDPVGLSVFAEEEVPEKSSDTVRVVMVGDSRIGAWPLPELTGYEFINRGIGSQTSIQVKERFAAHVLPLSPDIVLIQVGINDIKTIGLFPDRSTEILENTQSTLAELIDQAAQTGATVVMSSILPAGEITLARRAFWSDEIDGAVVQMNTYLRSLAESNQTDRVVWFDGYAAIADENGRMHTAYRKDELHLNADGYQALNQAFIRFLETLD